MKILELLLPFIFLYFFVATDGIFNTLNCGLQRMIKNSLWIRHFLIFFFIFFSFLLQWYTPSSIKVESFPKSDESRAHLRMKHLRLSFLKSLSIYIFFLLSTKCDSRYFIIIMGLLLGICFIYVYMKTKYDDRVILDIFKNIFISKSDIIRIIQKHKVGIQFHEDITHWLSFIKILLSISMILLVYGVIVYSRKQYLDHRQNFNIMTFIFGTNVCEQSI